MLTTFCALERPDGHIEMVNPALISYFHTLDEGEGATTALHFDNEHRLLVKGDYSHVLECLKRVA